MIAPRIRFLVLRGGAIGDFLVTLPALRAIRERWPEAYIECIGYPHIAQLGVVGGLFNRVESLDRAGMAAFFAKPASFTEEQTEKIRSFQVIFSWLHDSNGTVRENLLLAGARQVVYGSPLISAGCHATDHLFTPLAELALYPENMVPTLTLDSATRAAGRDWLAKRQWADATHVVHPGSGSPRKNWPLDRFVALSETIARDCGALPLIVLGEADASLREPLLAACPDARLLEQLTLVELAGVMSQVPNYVGNDSGITHLAAALGLRVTALFGPSNAVQWAPKGDRVTLLQAPSGNLSDIDLSEVVRASVVDSSARE